MSRQLQGLIAAVPAVVESARAEALTRHGALAKPPGSLGELEDLGARLAAMTARCPPQVPVRPALVVAAADHGVHAEGVSPWPQRVTTAMVEVLASGRASANAIAATVGARVAVVDVGVRYEPAAAPSLHAARVRPGTGNLRREPAMSIGEAIEAIGGGALVAADVLDSGVDLIVTGDMGIANTTASACLVAALTGREPGELTGRGTGIDDDTLARKREVVRDALARHGPEREPLAVLASLGGLEHAALVGVMLATAGRRRPIVLDGVVSNAAALVAVALCPALAGYLIAGHRSTEPGAGVALESLGLRALLDLDLRLGEGTGGLLAVPVVRSAAALLRDVATLAEVTEPRALRGRTIGR